MPTRSANIEKVCQQCGGTFRAAKATQRFCGKRCVSQWSVRRAQAASTAARRERHNRDPRFRVRACLYCGEMYAPTGSRQCYCSRSCWNRARTAAISQQPQRFYADLARERLQDTLRHFALHKNAAVCLVAGFIWRKFGITRALAYVEQTGTTAVVGA